MDVIDNICNKLNLNELDKIPALKDISAKTKVKPAHMGLAVMTIVLIFAVIGFGGKWLAFLIGFLYPAYMSFKAIETENETDDDKQWLTYWVVFSFMHVFDSLINFVLSIIPLYNVLKIAFNVWLWHPKTRGALVIYNNVIKNFLKKYEGVIDDQLEGIKKKVDEAQPMINNAARDLKREAVNKVIS